MTASLCTGFFALAGLTGCSDQSIQVYEVPKEERFEIAAAQHQHRPASQGRPHLHWDTLPAGWEALPPEGMRIADLQIRGEDGKMARLGVFALPGVGDIELETVNIWRAELELPDWGPQDLAQAQKVALGEESGSFYDLASVEVPEGQTVKNRILGAILPREDATWVLKMVGEADLVAGQKEEFLQFMAGLEFHGADAHAPEPQVVSANTERVPPSADLPAWTVPEGWQERPPGAMLLANWSVSKDGGQADVTVSKLSGDGGGWLANVNRWRGQLSLGPINAAALPEQTTEIEVDSDAASLVDINGTGRSGQNARMIAVAVPRGGETWFYKMMGDPAVVEGEKETFIQFIRSAY